MEGCVIFVLPGVLAMFGLSALYVAYGDTDAAAYRVAAPRVAIAPAATPVSPASR